MMMMTTMMTMTRKMMKTIMMTLIRMLLITGMIMRQFYYLWLF